VLWITCERKSIVVKVEREGGGFVARSAASGSDRLWVDDEQPAEAKSPPRCRFHRRGRSRPKKRVERGENRIGALSRVGDLRS
jgi:hypothetical protein